MTGKKSIENTPLPLFDTPQPWQTAIYRKRIIPTMIAANPNTFRREFGEWLDKNFAVWEAFEREANSIWDRGRRHYSARTIGEYLRHESALREQPNQHQFKLNDHYWPDLARLYMMLNPERDGFFERRVNPLSVRAA